MRNIKWLNEGIFVIHNNDSNFIIPYKGSFEKVKLIKENRNLDYTLYKDEGSGVLYDFIDLFLWIVALILLGFYIN